eukprot:gene7547-biopygen10587
MPDTGYNFLLGETAEDASRTRPERVCFFTIYRVGRVRDTSAAVSPWGHRTLARAWRGHGAGMARATGSLSQGKNWQFLWDFLATVWPGKHSDPVSVTLWPQPGPPSTVRDLLATT